MQVYLPMITILMNSMWLWSVHSVYGQGVYIQFKGNRLSNNSAIDITDIGVDDASVHCVTDKTDCCRRGDGGAPHGLGEWYFPNNGSAVGIEGNGLGGSFYRDRGPSVLRLHRRHNVMMPTGPFCCVIPDAVGLDQRMYIIVQVASATTISEGTQEENTEYEPTSFDNGLTPTETVIRTTVTEAGTLTTGTTTYIALPDLITTTIPNPFITGVHFQLNGASYSNNSRVNITDIGEDDDDSLICVTNNTDCCVNHVGEWYFPNGSAVKIEGAGEAFYRNRGPSVVRLHRRHNVMMPTGSFCCVVSDANGIDQKACVIIEAMATVTDLVTTTTESTRGATTIKPTDSTTHLFQLRLFEIQNCLEWVNEDASVKIEDISAAIISNINQRCQCGLSHENITDGVFRCFSASPQAVTFRALLHGAAKASSSEIISLIEQWISNDITIRVQSVLINVDSSCTVNISSFDDRECQQNSKQSRKNNVSGIIGGIASALLLVLILTSIIILLLLWFRKRRQVSLKYTRDSKNRVPMTEVNVHDNTPHEYEVLDKYSREYEEVAHVYLTKCPAYVPTIHTKT